MKNKNIVRGLGAALFKKKSYLLLYNEVNARQGTFTVRVSDDGMDFTTLTSNAKVVNINGPSDDFDVCDSFHISQDGKIYYLTYRKNKKDLCIARSKNLIDWEKVAQLEGHEGGAQIITDYLYAGRNVMFEGGQALYAYVSEDLVKWTRAKKPVVVIDDDQDEDENVKKDLELIDVQVVDDGVFVMYGVTIEDKKFARYEIYGALLEYGDPTKLIWKSHKPIYAMSSAQKERSTLFGAVVFDDYFVSYWSDHDGKMFLLRHYYDHEEDGGESGYIHTSDSDDENVQKITLERVPENPIMTPQCHCAWESKATYNPTAIVHDGVIHIIYRADGDDLMSVWGYASTVNGVTVDDRSAHCIYQRKTGTVRMPFPSPVSYTSGGNSAGGCEDPRAVLIDDTIYVTFTAFDGWGSVRVAMTSIALKDFLEKKWHWKRTVLISPPGEMNKNWVIFPEKINGKYAILHSFVPHILIDYFDSLDELDGKTFIRSNNMRPVDTSRTWDSWFRGVGPAPIKTDAGWLIFFHAMDHRKPDRYRLGALLLDLNDPTKELYRSKGPILEPEAEYENNGHKWGVIYCCGAVVKNGTLYVYYGGADKYVCVATAPLDKFLHDLTGSGEVRMNIN